MQVISNPNTSVKVVVNSDLIPIFMKNLLKSNSFHTFNDQTNQYYFVVDLKLRLCQKGEIYDKTENICYLCPKGQYSLNPLDNMCSNCPAHTLCNQGGFYIELESGYWRSNENSDQIYKCNTISYPCNGEYNSSCVFGYSGIICETCLSDDNNQFFKKGLYFCEKCGNVWIYTIGILIGLCVVFRLIFTLESDTKQDKFGFVLIKILTTHFQTLILISNVKIDLPNFLADFYNFQAPFSTADSLFSISECLNNTFMSIYMLKLIFSLIFLIFIIVIVVIFQTMRLILKKIPKKTLKMKIMTSLVIAVNFFQPWLINFYIQNISCDSYDGINYLAFNLRQKCWDSIHLMMSFMITIPCLLLLMIIYPMVKPIKISYFLIIFVIKI